MCVCHREGGVVNVRLLSLSALSLSLPTKCRMPPWMVYDRHTIMVCDSLPFAIRFLSWSARFATSRGRTLSHFVVCNRAAAQNATAQLCNPAIAQLYARVHSCRRSIARSLDHFPKRTITFNTSSLTFSFTNNHVAPNHSQNTMHISLYITQMVNIFVLAMHKKSTVNLFVLMYRYHSSLIGSLTQ